MKNTKSPRPFYEWRPALLVSLLILAVVLPACAPKKEAPAVTRVDISIPASAGDQPLTGRVFVMISRRDNPEPRRQVGSWGQTTPFFGADVERLNPGAPAVIDGDTLGYPVKSLREIPAGDYFVQALFNIYTEFKRSDGHTIWAHMDQWEGQQFNRSPGNFYCKTQKVRLDIGKRYTIKLSLDKVIPPVDVPPATEWVNGITIRSRLLTAFWGHPIHLGATVLLPKGYESHPDS